MSEIPMSLRRRPGTLSMLAPIVVSAAGQKMTASFFVRYFFVRYSQSILLSNL
jgi:hypothetical protein